MTGIARPKVLLPAFEVERREALGFRLGEERDDFLQPFAATLICLPR
jgi:hypothetical protein